MISKLAIIAFTASLVIASGTSRVGAQMLQQGSGNGAPPAAFCCTSFDAIDSPEEGLGCYAVTSGPSSVTSCNGVYFECPLESFSCAPQAAKKAAAAGDGASSLACSCGNALFN
jgi:hypothetical protein